MIKGMMLYVLALYLLGRAIRMMVDESYDKGKLEGRRAANELHRILNQPKTDVQRES